MIYDRITFPQSTKSKKNQTPLKKCVRLNCSHEQLHLSHLYNNNNNNTHKIIILTIQKQITNTKFMFSLQKCKVNNGSCQELWFAVGQVKQL